MENVRYSIELDGDTFVETLEIEGYVATRRWENSEDDDCELVTDDNDFSEQFDGLIDEDVCLMIEKSYDENEYVVDFADFISLCEVDEDDDEY